MARSGCKYEKVILDVIEEKGEAGTAAIFEKLPNLAKSYLSLIMCRLVAENRLMCRKEKNSKFYKVVQ